MTTFIDGEVGEGLCWGEAHCRSLRFGRDDKLNRRRGGGGFVLGRGALQISPLRFASVEMTNFDRRRVGGRFVLGRGALRISPLRYAPVEMTTLIDGELGGRFVLGLGALQISPLRY